MAVDVFVKLDDGLTRLISNVNLCMPPRQDTITKGPQWIDLQKKNGDVVTLNFRSWSVREKVPEKVALKKDGSVLDDGYRSTGGFDSVTIQRRGISVHGSDA